MNERAVYDRLDDYEAQARARGVRDSEGVAGQVMVRLWTLLRRGQDVTPRLERLVLNGFIVDALRLESRAVPLGRGAENDRVPAPAVPDVEAALFASSLVALLYDMPRPQAIAWTLVNIHGLSQGEAAEYMGHTREWVNRLNEQARVTLAEGVVA